MMKTRRRRDEEEANILIWEFAKKRNNCYCSHMCLCLCGGRLFNMLSINSMSALPFRVCYANDNTRHTCSRVRGNTIKSHHKVWAKLRSGLERIFSQSRDVCWKNINFQRRFLSTRLEGSEKGWGRSDWENFLVNIKNIPRNYEKCVYAKNRFFLRLRLRLAPVLFAQDFIHTSLDFYLLLWRNSKMA